MLKVKFKNIYLLLSLPDKKSPLIHVSFILVQIVFSCLLHVEFKFTSFLDLIFSLNIELLCVCVCVFVFVFFSFSCFFFYPFLHVCYILWKIFLWWSLKITLSSENFMCRYWRDVVKDERKVDDTESHGVCRVIWSYFFSLLSFSKSRSRYEADLIVSVVSFSQVFSGLMGCIKPRTYRNVKKQNIIFIAVIEIKWSG